ncbi:MAG: Maf family protein, partial [Acutalibacteraceae bacterium]|nr:Maf family protein [Acutalibacteraceae bacterium]
MEFDNVILASASPRRRELLKFITDDFIIKASSAEETVPENLPAEEAPEFLAMLKAKDIATENPQSLVIGAD